jgi:hypothetical protein
MGLCTSGCGSTVAGENIYCKQCAALHVLGLKFGATREEAKEAYRTLAKVWHPDRFPGDEQLHKKAETRLSEINSAYQYLKQNPYVHTAGPQRATTQARPWTYAPQEKKQAGATPRQEAPPRPVVSPSPQSGKSAARSWGLGMFFIRLAVLGLAVVFAKYWLLSPIDHASKIRTEAIQQIANSTETFQHIADEMKAVTLFGDTVPDARSPFGAKTIASTDPATPSKDTRALVSVTGTYAGTVHNTSAKVQAKAVMILKQDKESVSGCFLVYPPLYGSGPVSGEIQQSTLYLQAKSALFLIVFKGYANGNRAAGSYEVYQTSGANQFGEFSLVKNANAVSASQDAGNCPSNSNLPTAASESLEK